MALQTYATADDLSPWVDTEPDAIDRYLLAASIVVAKACNVSPYDPPADTAVEPMRDATCAQVQAWVVLGIQPGSLGLDPAIAPVKKTSINGADVERDTNGNLAALQSAANDIAPQAAAILLQAGLLYVPLPLGAPDDDRLPDWGQGRQPCSPFADPLSGEVQYLGWWT